MKTTVTRLRVILWFGFFIFYQNIIRLLANHSSLKTEDGKMSEETVENTIKQAKIKRNCKAGLTRLSKTGTWKVRSCIFGTRFQTRGVYFANKGR